MLQLVLKTLAFDLRRRSGTSWVRCGHDVFGSVESAELVGREFLIRAAALRLYRPELAAQDLAVFDRRDGSIVATIQDLGEMAEVRVADVIVLQPSTRKRRRHGLGGGFAWRCQAPACGHTFPSVRAAGRALSGAGCPRCGGREIDLTRKVIA